jgi:TorA maturation chaperone TorD
MIHTMDPQAADLHARRIVASALAEALADPHMARTFDRAAAPAELLRHAWRLAAAPHQQLGRRDLSIGETAPSEADIEPVIHWLSLTPERQRAAHLQLFGLIGGKACSPHETEYLSSRDAFHRAQQLADVAGFYLAFGLEPDPQRHQRPDHVSLELTFVAVLLEKLAWLARDSASAEHVSTCREALTSFLADHVIPWMPLFSQRVARRAAEAAARQADPSHGDDVRLLAGVAIALGAWAGIERLNADLPPLRQIPQIDSVESIEPESECESCATCAELP